MIFHEDKLPGFFQILLLGGKSVCRVVIKHDIRIPEDRISGIFPEVGRDIIDAPVPFAQILSSFRVLLQKRKKPSVCFFISFPHMPGGTVESDKQIQRDTQQRSRHDQYDPGHLNRAASFLAAQSKDDNHCKEVINNRESSGVFSQPRMQRDS